MLAQIADLDRLAHPVNNVFVNGDGDNLFEDSEAMKDFLARPHTASGIADWKNEGGRNWHKMYKEMQGTFRSIKIDGARNARTKLLVDSGIIDTFAAVYISKIDSVLQTSQLRKADDPKYHDAFADYVDALIDATKAKLELGNDNAGAGTFESQILSKLRFLTADVGSLKSPLPLFCLPYALACVAEWKKYLQSIREVSSQLLRPLLAASFTCE